MSLSSHLSRVEAFGFPRSVFPVSYNGHRLALLHNDAHYEEDEWRVLVHFTLYCQHCDETSTVRGRFPHGDTEMNAVALAKTATFIPFKHKECT